MIVKKIKDKYEDTIEVGSGYSTNNEFVFIAIEEGDDSFATVALDIDSAKAVIKAIKKTIKYVEKAQA